MSWFRRIAVCLSGAGYRRLLAIARELGRPPTALVGRAGAEFTPSFGCPRKIRSVGAARSGRSDLSERVEELLAGFPGGL
jgi:hypothetical protein